MHIWFAESFLGKDMSTTRIRILNNTWGSAAFFWGGVFLQIRRLFLFLFLASIMFLLLLLLLLLHFQSEFSKKEEHM